MKKINKGGRPHQPKINSINLEQVKILIEKGFIDAEVCKFYKINPDTFTEWKKKYKWFADTVNEAKKKPNEEVKKALYLRAIGYSHPEDKVFCEGGRVTVVPTIKYYPPDTAACFIWLKNRVPDEWTDRTEIDLGLKDNLIDKFKELPVAELLLKAKTLMNKI